MGKQLMVLKDGNKSAELKKISSIHEASRERKYKIRCLSPKLEIYLGPIGERI